MKKDLIYKLAVFYQQKIQKQEFSLSLTRYFRDVFKVYLDNGSTIENDRVKIVNSKITDEEKTIEATKLFDEVIEVPKLTEETMTKIEESGLKITPIDLALLEEAMK